MTLLKIQLRIVFEKGEKMNKERCIISTVFYWARFIFLIAAIVCFCLCVFVDFSETWTAIILAIGFFCAFSTGECHAYLRAEKIAEKLAGPDWRNKI